MAKKFARLPKLEHLFLGLASPIDINIVRDESALLHTYTVYQLLTGDDTVLDRGERKEDWGNASIDVF